VALPRRHDNVAAINTPNRVNLDFVDLLYAVPVAGLATRVGESDIEHLGASTWSDIGLALVALTLGWIGHHSNRRRREDEAPDPPWANQRPFWEGSFVQFWIEVLVIGAYFALSARLSLPLRPPAHPGALNGQVEWKAWWLLGLFVAYLAWDVVDVRLASARAGDKRTVAPFRYKRWGKRATEGGVVTALFIVIFIAVLCSAPGGPYRTLPFDLVCLLLLYIYRVGQHAWIGAGPPTRLTRARVAVLAIVGLVVVLWLTGVLWWMFSAERVPMVISRLRPAVGPASGETSVAATGEYFDEHGTAFTFGAVRATSVICKSATECTLVTPALQLTASKAAEVDVVASLRDGDAKSNAFHYTYRRVPLEHVDHVLVELSQHGRALLRHRLGLACRNDDLNGLLEPGSASPPSVQTFATDRCPRLHLRVTRAIGTVFVAHRVG
jgi:hypothetical protein